MYISKISLRNYRKFKKIDIEFDKKLTVLVGENGSGKTSILEGITVAIGTFFFALNGIQSIRIKETDIHNKYSSLRGNIEVQKQFPVEIIATGKINGEEKKWKRSLNSIGGKTTSIDAREMITLSKSYQERLMNGDATLKLPLIAYYGANCLWDINKKKWDGLYKQNNRTNGYIDCLNGKTNMKLLLDWFIRMNIKANQNGKFNETYIAVKIAMEKCFSSLTNIEDVNIFVNPDTFNIEINYFDLKNGRIQLPLEKLNNGYKCALSLIGDIAYRMATLNPQLSKNVLNETEGIVLIDEGNLHLHSMLQQDILNILIETFPKIQFIVTTHSPAIMNSITNGKLLIIDNE